MEREVFHEQTVFLTGGSGFLGTLLACKILSDTECAQLILLCRGGQSCLLKQWRRSLPLKLFLMVSSDSRLRVVEGDICEASLALDFELEKSLQSEVNIVIHAASSINLQASLTKIARSVIQGTINVAHFALGCTDLTRFVYISSAYANSHLHHLDTQTAIIEQIYPLEESDSQMRTAQAEWNDLCKYGTTTSYQRCSFPWPYAYAKHLTERLLYEMFSFTQTTQKDPSVHARAEHIRDKLIIVRPSVIGPAEAYPYAGWQVARSAPVTAVMSHLVLSPAFRLTFRSDLVDPTSQAKVDEVPVDLVANRIIAHISAQSSGVIHAVCGLENCFTLKDYVNYIRPLRRLPWSTKMVWKKAEIESDDVCRLARVFRIIGVCYAFDGSMTVALWSRMSPEQKQVFPLLAGSSMGSSRATRLSKREPGMSDTMTYMLRKRGLPGWFLPLLYRSEN